ncbi:MAG: sigma-54-dependent Fis family transcriptional regulator [Deltaproteobacteria bacterium]|nr:sigma-54-dependent Fis family transcriptional regulator [Deltaproteobacteria bacterium]
MLLVEDDRSTLDSLTAALSDAGLEVIAAGSGEEAIARLKLSPVDVVVTDVMMGRVSGIDLLNHIQQHYPDTAVILVTAFGTIEMAVDAMRRGAFDYLTKPINLDRLELLVQRAHGRQNLVKENRALKHELEERFSVTGIIGQSPAMRAVLERVEQVAPTNASVLLLGESGTGKELLASAIHQLSGRASGPLVKVNCVALPESLIESELFGHERGAFTGAIRTRRGRFELAHGGTLFLDEIGDLSIGTQLKLLRAIQEREIERVGGQTQIPVDVRLITATNRNLERAVAEGTFREELYYRLKVVTIELPPLRQRLEDIPLLLQFFLAQFRKEHGKKVEGLSRAALHRLRSYRWPGNVRELRNVIESLVVSSTGAEISAEQLPEGIVANRGPDLLTMPMGVRLGDVEKTYILRTLELAGGNKSKAAQMLGIGKKTLYRRLEEYGIRVPGDRAHGNGESSDD